MSYHYTNYLNLEETEKNIQKVNSSINFDKTNELIKQVKELELTVHNISNLIIKHVDKGIEKVE